MSQNSHTFGSVAVQFRQVVSGLEQLRTINLITSHKSLLALLASLSLAACGGGGSEAGSTPPPSNNAPRANAGVDQTVDELAAVTLDGSASSDPDAGTTLTYSWSQSAGTTVTLSSTTTAQPTFDAPDVAAANSPDVLQFDLTVSDGRANHTDAVSITVNIPRPISTAIT